MIMIAQLPPPHANRHFGGGKGERDGQPALLCAKGGHTGKTKWEMLVYVAEMARWPVNTSDEDESDVF